MSEPFTCTAEKPWNKDMGIEPERTSHPGVEEVIFRDCFCCQLYRCPHCDLEWKADPMTHEPCKRLGMPLEWKDAPYGADAVMGDHENRDGVHFTIEFVPTCYRRGQFKLLIEVLDKDRTWGCFDEQDQPMRYFHSMDRLKGEADAIALVLAKDHERKVNGPLPGDKPKGNS